jgi:hypothetical protein
MTSRIKRSHISLTKNKDIRYIDKTVIDEVLTRRVAVLAINSASVPDIMKQLALSRQAVEMIQASPKYKEVVQQAGEEETAKALTKAKLDLTRLSAKAVKVVEKAMDSALDGTGSMREGLGAAQLALKAAGIHENEEKQSDGVINIILPTGVEKTVTYEVKNEE